MKAQNNVYPYFTVCVCLFFFFFPSCRQETALERALRLAGDNRAELERVLEYYRSDSLKLKAAEFLIRNMPYHIGVHEWIEDPQGQSYEFDLEIGIYDEILMSRMDSLSACGYKIRTEKHRDIEVVSADYLIENIDLAFEVWQKPWSRSFSFDDFCRYILPYRIMNEPLCSLRREMQQRYLHYLDSAGFTTPGEACLFLNGMLKKRYTYAGFSPTYPSIEEMNKNGRSNCEGLAIFYAFLLRAVGIPTVVDRTVWAKSTDGHAWCAMLDENHIFQTFSGGDSDFETFRIVFSKRRKLIPPKVYRRTFDIQRPDIVMEDDGYRTFLKNPYYQDVTDSYYNPFFDLRVTLPLEAGEKDSYIYLCGSGTNNYQVLALGERKGRECIVKNVVGDNNFIIAECRDGANLNFLTGVLYLDSLGNVTEGIRE